MDKAVTRPPSAYAIRVAGVTRSLGALAQAVLQPTDLVVERGELVALTGPSGSGKSTLLYLLGVLDRATSGLIWIDGTEVACLGDVERARIRRDKLGFVFQFHFLLPEFTVLENVELPMLRRGLSADTARTRALDTLRRLDLESLRERRPTQLSGGQQQRVSIARAVAGRPAIVLADEPTGNLDSVNGELVMTLFERLNREDGTTIVFVTHDERFAGRASRKIVLKDGAIIDDRLRSARDRGHPSGDSTPMAPMLVR